MGIIKERLHRVDIQVVIPDAQMLDGFVCIGLVYNEDAVLELPHQVICNQNLGELCIAIRVLHHLSWHVWILYILGGVWHIYTRHL
jgi:hypothetical protein